VKIAFEIAQVPVRPQGTHMERPSRRLGLNSLGIGRFRSGHRTE